MSTKRQELIDGTFARAHIDEPVFVLRAQDELAPQIVRWWAREAKLAGVNDAKVKDALELAKQMERWQAVRGSKTPD